MSKNDDSSSDPLISAPAQFKRLIANFLSKLELANNQAARAQEIYDAILAGLESVQSAMKGTPTDPSSVKDKLGRFISELQEAAGCSDEAQILIDAVQAELDSLLEGSLRESDVVDCEAATLENLAVKPEPDGSYSITANGITFLLSARLGAMVEVLAADKDALGLEADDFADNLVPFKARADLISWLSLTERTFASSLNRLKEALKKAGLRGLVETKWVNKSQFHRLRVRATRTGRKSRW